MKFAPKIDEGVHNVLTEFQIDAHHRSVKKKCFKFESVKKIT